MDHLTPEKRSWNMGRIRSIDTKPEKKIRSLLHSLGYRFRLHSKKLPGKPDIFLKKYKTVIFVNGCFWHNHGCVNSKIPEKNTSYWLSVFEKNKARDYENTRKLKILGYKIINIWECVLRDDKSKERLFNNLEKILQTV